MSGSITEIDPKNANIQEFDHNQPHYFYLMSFKLLLEHGRPHFMPDLPVFGIFSNF